MGTKKELDINTEAKIKNAARLVFHKKGFAATRTRDIAEEAGINLALLNYYFRSKEKLFNIIMLETMQDFMQSFYGAFNDENTSLDEKIEIIASNYIDLLMVEPDIPLFIMSEIRINPKELIERFNAKQIFFNSVFAVQYRRAQEQGEISNMSMYHFMMNLLGMLIFPFIAGPMIKATADMEDEDFQELMLERKKRIPVWMKTIMKKSEKL